MDGAAPNRVARDAAQHASRDVGLWLCGVDDAKQVDPVRREREPISAVAPGAADHELGAPEIAEYVSHESAGDPHLGGDAPGTQQPRLVIGRSRRTVLVLGQGEHRSHGVVASEGQGYAHVGSLAIHATDR